MTAVTFDTYKIVKRLTSEGISEKQATVIVDAIQESQQHIHDVREEDLSQLATKGDLITTKADLKAQMSDLEVRLMNARREDMRWVFSLFLAVIGLLVTILLKLH